MKYPPPPPDHPPTHPPEVKRSLGRRELPGTRHVQMLSETPEVERGSLEKPPPRVSLVLTIS